MKEDRSPFLAVDCRVHLCNLRPEVFEAIQTSLTFKNPKYEQTRKFSPYNFISPKIPRNIKLWRKVGEVLSVPRGYSFETVGGFDFLPKTFQQSRNNFAYGTHLARFPKPHYTLTGIQERALEAFVRGEPKRPFNTYLFVMPTGTGKTVTAAVAAAKTRERTLILVHNQLIASQWRRDLAGCFNLANKDIGLVRQNTIRLGDQFTIAFLQTLFKRPKVWQDIRYSFGCMIFDECHIVPARTFYDIADDCPSLYRIGLTATPTRNDGLHDIMFNVFGQPFYDLSTDSNVESEVSIPVSDVIVRHTNFVPDVPKGMPLDISTTVKEQAFCEDRNRQIVADVKKEVSEGHSCLVICLRKAHVEILIRMLADRMVLALPLTGSLTKKKVRDYEAKLLDRSCRVAVATSQFVKLGTSINPLDRLFIACVVANEKDLLQLAGRIRRKADSKNDAVIYDYVDSKVRMLWNHFRKRAKVYKKMGVERFRKAEFV